MKKEKGTYKLSQMRPIVEGYRDFRGTKKEYCARYDLNPYTFDYWRTRVKESEASTTKKEKAPTRKTGFVAITAPVSSPSLNYIIHLPDGKRIEVPNTTPLSTGVIGSIFLQNFIRLSKDLASFSDEIPLKMEYFSKVLRNLQNIVLRNSTKHLEPINPALSILTQLLQIPI